MKKQDIINLMSGPMKLRQARYLGRLEWWKRDEWSPYEIAVLQLCQRRLCMNFDDFHKSVESALGRPVWTHEFADTQRLLEELKCLIPTPTLQEIIDKLPHKKLMIVKVQSDTSETD